MSYASEDNEEHVFHDYDQAHGELGAELGKTSFTESKDEEPPNNIVSIVTYLLVILVIVIIIFVYSLKV